MTAPPLLEAARELLDYLETLARPACLIGGMVVARWGEPRATRDVDATVLADFGEEASLLSALLRKFPSRDPAPLPRAELGRLALLTASNGVQLDLKLVAACPGDLVDVTGIVRRQGRRLDADRVRYWGRAFAEITEDPELLRPFDEAMRGIG